MQFIFLISKSLIGLINFAMSYYCSQLNLVLTSFGKSLTQVPASYVKYFASLLLSLVLQKCKTMVNIIGMKQNVNC